VSDPRFLLPKGALFTPPPWALRDAPGAAPPSGRGKSKPRPGAGAPASLKPLRCAILALDTAATTGAAFLHPELWSFETSQGTTVTRDVRIAWTEVVKKPRPELFTRALADALALDLPLVVVSEKWGSGTSANDPRATKAMLGGLNATWGKYDLCREMAGIPKSRVVRVMPTEWQPAIVGAHLRGMEPPARKAEIQTFLRRHYALDVTTDDADAVCIGLFGMRDARVLAALPKQRKTKR
jgi:hypothetical protein